MQIPLPLRRAAIRCAYAGMRTYWFVFRPQLSGVKCVVTHDGDVLLVRHTYGARDWDLPGGTMRRRELPLNAARREMREELGREIDDWTALGELFVTTNHHRDNLYLFEGRLADRRIDLDLMELAEARWFSPERLPSELGRFVRPILSRIKKT